MVRTYLDKYGALLKHSNIAYNNLIVKLLQCCAKTSIHQLFLCQNSYFGTNLPKFCAIWYVQLLVLVKIKEQLQARLSCNQLDLNIAISNLWLSIESYMKVQAISYNKSYSYNTFFKFDTSLSVQMAKIDSYVYVFTKTYTCDQFDH